MANPALIRSSCPASSSDFTQQYKRSVHPIVACSTLHPLVVFEEKSLVNKLSSLSTALTCVVWKDILDALNRVKNASMSSRLVGLHYAALLGQIRSLHDSEMFNRFKDEAKSAASKLDYDKENKRTMKNKLFRDET